MNKQTWYIQATEYYLVFFSSYQAIKKYGGNLSIYSQGKEANLKR
jgi:hypothetical protein